MSTLSIAMICKDAQHELARSLTSVKAIADEIVIILDSGTSDNSAAIAAEFNATVIEQDWLGFAAQRNLNTQHCSSDWILYLDQDEVLTPELAQEIRTVIQSDQFQGYRINRDTVYLGQQLNYSWQPDFHLRLVRRDANPDWQGAYVHESLHIDGKIADLQHSMQHYSYTSIKQHYDQTVKYSWLGGKQLFENGKKFSWHKLVLNPLWAFVRTYFIRRSCLDGVAGLSVAVSAAVATFLKYLVLWELHRGK